MTQYIGTNTCPIHPDLTTIIVTSTGPPPARGVPICSTCWEEASDCTKSKIRNVISMWNKGLITTEERQQDIEMAIIAGYGPERDEQAHPGTCPCPFCVKQRLLKRLA